MAHVHITPMAHFQPNKAKIKLDNLAKILYCDTVSLLVLSDIENHVQYIIILCSKNRNGHIS